MIFLLYLLNTSILTDYGDYRFRKIEPEKAKELLADGKFTSAVGHEGTAQVISAKLDLPIPTNRVAIKMAEGDQAVVFRVTQRLPEGKILSAEELKGIPSEFGLLTRVS